MRRYFKDPHSEKVEDVDAFKILLIVMFGLWYLLFAQLWRHLAIWVGILVAAFFLNVYVDPRCIAIASLGLHLFYCIFIQRIIVNAYLQKGWIEVPPPPPYTQPES